jgi:hypothetical protein
MGMSTVVQPADLSSGAGDLIVEAGVGLADPLAGVDTPGAADHRPADPGAELVTDSTFCHRFPGDVPGVNVGPVLDRRRHAWGGRNLGGANLPEPR